MNQLPRVWTALCSLVVVASGAACTPFVTQRALQTSAAQPALGASALRTLTPFFPTPNLYTTPRPVPVGELAATASMEVAAEVTPATGPDGERAFGEVWPFVVTANVRFGVADDFEAGLRSGMASGPGFYGKWVLSRRAPQVALVPTNVLVFVENEARDEVVGLGLDHHVPLLLGVDLGSRVTLLASAGYSIRFAGGPPETSDTIPLGRAGLGAEVRLDELSIHPEVTALAPLWSRHPMYLAAGLGATLGTAAGARPRKAPK